MQENNLIFLEEEESQQQNVAQGESGKQKKGIQQIEEKIKLHVFNVFCALLKNFELASWKIYILLIIEFIQFLSFSFHPSMEEQWKGKSDIDYINYFIQAFGIYRWFDLLNVSWSSYLLSFYILMLVIFLIFVDFLYVSFAVNNVKHSLSFTWPVTILQYVCFLMITVLFQPFIEIFLNMLGCIEMTAQELIDNGSQPELSSTSSNVLVLSSYNQITCFSSTHIMHAAFAIIISLIALAMNIAIVFLFFESRNIHTNQFAKLNSRVDVFQNFLKFFLVCVFAFLQGDSFLMFKTLILVIFSCISFVNYYIQRPYYSQMVNKFMCVLYGIFAWTNIILLISACLDKTQFNLAFIIYFLGIPIIIILILTQKRYGLKALLVPQNKHQKGEEALNQFIEILSLVESKDTKRESAILIKGYVQYHEMQCTEDDCPLKQLQKTIIKQNNRLSQANSDKKVGNQSSSNNNQKIIYNEINSLLLNHTKKLLEKSIKMFPLCTIIRIHYSSFLLEQMGNKREAMKELNLCMKFKPSLDQQFMIHRYKRLIGDSLVEGGKESGGYEYISAMNYQSSFKKCKSNIEKVALLHFEFWNHLLEDSPDLGRLQDIGKKIDESIKVVDYYWSQMQLIYPNQAKALKLYAMFQVEVLNDKDGGNELFQKARDATSIKANLEINANDDISGGIMGSGQQDGSPLVYISGENDKLGIIQNLNLSTCKIFGFLRKEELINKNIKALQPVIYQIHHDEFIKNALLKQGDSITNRERNVYGKHLSGYIFPLNLQIKYLQSFLHGKQFVATLKNDKKAINTSVAYMITDKNGIIMDLSSSAIQLLDIDKQKMAKKRIIYDIKILLPSLFSNENVEKYNSKQGAPITYFFPNVIESQLMAKNDQSTNNLKFKTICDLDDGGINDENKSDYSFASIDEDNDTSKNYLGLKSHQFMSYDDGDQNQNNSGAEQQEEQLENKVAALDKKQEFHCNLYPIIFQSISESDIQGYAIRLEAQDQDNVIQEEEVRKDKNSKKIIQKMVKMASFQFSFSPIYKKFVRELIDSENNENLVDQAYLHVKKENLKRSEDKPKLTVMNYLNQLKIKMEKQEEINNAALGDDYIREVEEYSEESHSEDDFMGKGVDKQSTKMSGNMSESKKEEQANAAMKEAQQKDFSKRIALLISQRFMPGSETAEKLIEKIQEITEILKIKQSVGEGIKTYNYFDGELSLVEEQKGKLLIDKTTQQAEIVINEEEEDDKKEENDELVLKNTLKSRKTFQNTLNDKSTPPSIRNLQYVSNIMLLIFIALAIADYALVRTQLGIIASNFTSIQNSFMLISEMQESAYHIRSLAFYARNNSPNLTTSYINNAYIDLKASLTELYSLQNSINVQKLDISQAHTNILSGKSVPMYFNQQNNITNITYLYFSLTEALLQISSSLFTITNLPTSGFVDTNDDIFYFMYNNFADMLSSLEQSSQLFVQELLDRTSNNQEANRIVFYCSIACIIMSVLLLVPVVQTVRNTKQKYLQVFLEIDNNNIRKLSSKCEKFMNMLQDEGNEELESNDEELEDLARMDHESEYLTSRRSKKKRAKNTIKNRGRFIMKQIFGMLLIEAYYFAVFFTENSFIKQCNITAEEMNLTASVEPNFWLGLNAQRELINDKTRPILHQNSFAMSLSMIQSIQDLNSNMQQEHLSNENELEDTYKNKYNSVMLDDLCGSAQSLLYNQTSINCTSFISGSATQGLHTVIVRFQDTLRETLANYQLAKNVTKAVNVVLNSNEMTELFRMQRYLISLQMESLVQVLQETIQSDINVNLENRLAFFTVFIIILLMMFVLIWMPFINGLTNELHSTKRILLLIPLEMIVTMKAISNLFNHNVGKNKQ